MSLLPDGRVIVADADRHIHVYSPTGAVLADLDVRVRMMSLRREGPRLVALPNCLSNVAAPLVIDLERYHVVARLEGHVGCVFSARWMPGGQILTAGGDGTARLWDVTTGQMLRIYRWGTRFLGDAVVVSGIVIAGDADGYLRFWDAATGARLWMLSAHKAAIVGVHVESGDFVTRGFTGEISRWRISNPEDVIEACSRHGPCAIVP